MKINGFVELDSQWVIQETNKYLERIVKWRTEERQKTLDNFREEYEGRGFSLFKKKVKLTDENIEEVMDKERGYYNMFYIPLQQWVAHRYSDIESDMKELNSSAKLVNTILVNTDLAGTLQRWEGYE